MAEHRNLTGASLHEPKGAAGAAAETVYQSNGAGSGSWLPLSVPGVNTATSGEIYVANGAGGASWEDIQNNPLGRASAASVSGVTPLVAGDLHVPADYISIATTFSFNLTLGSLTHDGITGEFIVGEDGYYRITSWVAASASSINATVGFDILVDGVQGGISSPVVTTKIKDAGSIVTVTGFGIGFFTTGTRIGLAMASDTTTNVTIFEGVFDMEKLRGA